MEIFVIILVSFKKMISVSSIRVYKNSSSRSSWWPETRFAFYLREDEWRSQDSISQILHDVPCNSSKGKRASKEMVRNSSWSTSYPSFMHVEENHGTGQGEKLKKIHENSLSPKLLFFLSGEDRPQDIPSMGPKKIWSTSLIDFDLSVNGSSSLKKWIQIFKARIDLLTTDQKCKPQSLLCTVLRDEIISCHKKKQKFKEPNSFSMEIPREALAQVVTKVMQDIKSRPNKIVVFCPTSSFLLLEESRVGTLVFGANITDDLNNSVDGTSCVSVVLLAYR